MAPPMQVRQLTLRPRPAQKEFSGVMLPAWRMLAAGARMIFAWFSETSPTTASAPTRIAADGGGNLYVTEAGASKLGKLPFSAGAFTTWTEYPVREEFFGPTSFSLNGVTTDSSGNAWFAYAER